MADEINNHPRDSTGQLQTRPIQLLHAYTRHYRYPAFQWRTRPIAINNSKPGFHAEIKAGQYILQVWHFQCHNDHIAHTRVFDGWKLMTMVHEN